MCVYIYIYIVKVSDLKAPFSLGVGEGTTPFPGLLHFTLDLIMLSIKQGNIKYYF